MHSFNFTAAVILKLICFYALASITLIFLGNKSGDYEEVRDHTYTKLLENGTLLLHHVKEDQEGFYLCQADNGIGPAIGKVIQLRVNCIYS